MVADKYNDNEFKNWIAMMSCDLWEKKTLQITSHLNGHIASHVVTTFVPMMWATAKINAQFSISNQYHIILEYGEESNFNL